MNKREANRLSMFNGVISLMDSNPGKYSSIPVVGETVANFKNLVEEIKASDLEFVGGTKDETADKEMKEENLQNLIYKIASALFVLGVKTKNTELMVNCKITKSLLDRMRDPLLINKATEILTFANSYTEALTDYGITAEVIIETQTALDDYSSSSGKQKEEYADISSRREWLSRTFSEASAMLEDELDPLMELFSQSDPDFYNSYQSARIIKDMG